jgi:DNA-binding NarL/FixJ family response regulator
MAHKVLIIRNDDLGWGELAQAIRRLPEMEIVGDTLDTQEAGRIAQAHQPSLILAPAVSGSRLLLPSLNEMQRTHSPTSKVVIFCGQWNPIYLTHFLGGGIVGFFRWSDLTISLLPMCLLLVASGNIGLGSWVVTQDVLAAMGGMLAFPATGQQFSQRERQVLTLLSQGFTREDIARQLNVSVVTIKREIAELQTKLQAPNSFILGVQAARRGLVQ